MTPFRLAAIAFALVLGHSHSAPLPKELRDNDHAKIVGVWKLVESGSNGIPLNKGDGSSWQFEREGKAAIIREGGKIDGEIKFTIDPTTTPKEFDWLPNWGQYRGCYTLEGDKLVLFIRSGTPENRAKEAKITPGVEVYSFERTK